MNLPPEVQEMLQKLLVDLNITPVPPVRLRVCVCRALPVMNFVKCVSLPTLSLLTHTTPHPPPPPPTTHTHTQPEDPNEPTSVLLPLPKPDADPTSLQEQPGTVEWRAPHIDWDPWTCRSAYQEGGPYAQIEPVSLCAYCRLV